VCVAGAALGARCKPALFCLGLTLTSGLWPGGGLAGCWPTARGTPELRGRFTALSVNARVRAARCRCILPPAAVDPGPAFAAPQRRVGSSPGRCPAAEVGFAPPPPPALRADRPDPTPLRGSCLPLGRTRAGPLRGSPGRGAALLRPRRAAKLREWPARGELIGAGPSSRLYLLRLCHLRLLGFHKANALRSRRFHWENLAKLWVSGIWLWFSNLHPPPHLLVFRKKEVAVKTRFLSPRCSPRLESFNLLLGTRSFPQQPGWCRKRRIKPSVRVEWGETRYLGRAGGIAGGAVCPVGQRCLGPGWVRSSVSELAGVLLLPFVFLQILPSLFAGNPCIFFFISRKSDKFEQNYAVDGFWREKGIIFPYSAWLNAVNVGRCRCWECRWVQRARSQLPCGINECEREHGPALGVCRGLLAPGRRGGGRSTPLPRSGARALPWRGLSVLGSPPRALLPGRRARPQAVPRAVRCAVRAGSARRRGRSWARTPLGAVSLIRRLETLLCWCRCLLRSSLCCWLK